MAAVEQMLIRVHEVSSSHTAQLTAVVWDVSETKKTEPSPDMPPPSFSTIVAAQAQSSEVARRTHSQATPMASKPATNTPRAEHQAGHG